jgi:septal ring-binding cell division protein DamX
MALRSRDSVEELMRKYEELAPFAVFTVQKGTRPLHVLLQGDYPDVESARAAKARFPRKIHKQDALWIRRFDKVQDCWNNDGTGQQREAAP